MPSVTNEKDLLNVEVRKALIKKWGESRNQERKAEAFKAYECMKDQTINYVYELLLAQLDPETVYEMQYSMTNVSILRKVIEKLAKVYANGVKRTGTTDAETKAIEALAEYLKLNTAMKKTNKYYRAFHNCLAYVRPVKSDDKYDIKVEVLAPFYYDAVENPDNPETALAIVLSDYAPKRPSLYAIGDAALANRTLKNRIGIVRDDGENVAQLSQSFSAPAGNGNTLAEAEDHRRFIWWSKNYHFTTNVKGEIVDQPVSDVQNEGSPTDPENPIKELPFANFCYAQDGQFFSEGGRDLIDSGVKINTMLTNVLHIGVSQGFGQLYMTGKNLPKSVKVGANHCVQLEVADKDEPVPQIGFLNSNPPLSDLKSLIEMYMALMLTTNNLSTSGFASSLSGGKDFASGVAMMLDKAESIEDVADQSQVFMDNEPRVLDLATTWHEVYKSKNLLTEAASVLVMPAEPEKEKLIFPPAKPLMGESDQIDILQKRKDLGLNTQIELIMRDNPGMTEEEAQKKLAKILEEKIANAAQFGVPGAQGVDPNGNQSKDGSGQPIKDGLNAGPKPGNFPPAGKNSDQNQK